ncbi:NAC domain protein [Melia azedarach]|uniref:NAC domain protein n=1 Tax=Melia azedarach TaxID=155640 RepID=A0ACC1XE37_MELAZ|nr:NAC domain protein [Melia azedarach]
MLLVQDSDQPMKFSPVITLLGKCLIVLMAQFFPLIKQVDVYKCEPWLLLKDAHNFGDGIMYFFTALKMKYRTGKNVNRVAGDGFWRKTGNSSYVKGEDGMPIATKTPLAYYRNGQKPGESKKTKWLMKEFILERQIAEKSNTLALCVIYLHDRKRKQCDRGDQNVVLDDQGALVTEPNDHVPCYYPSDVTDFGYFYQPPQLLSEPSTENLDFHRNQDSYNPEINSSSNPSATPDILPGVTIQSGNSNQNLSNRKIKSQGATDTSMNYLDDQSSLSDFLLLDDFDEEEFLNHSLQELRRLLDDNKLPPEESEDPSRTAGPSTNND